MFFKKLLVDKFSSLLIDNPLVADRRSSSTRASHEAEIDDILNLIDILDLQSEFSCVKFVACNLDKLPKFGPEEINIAAVVNRQAKVEASIQDISSQVHELATSQEKLLMERSAMKDMAAAVEQIVANSASHHPDIESNSRLVVELQGKLETFSSSVCSRLDHLNSLCRSSGRASAISQQPASQSAKHVDTIDRKSNLIIFGVAEDRDISVWHRAVDDILNFVVDRHVDVTDMFRLGRYVADGSGATRKPRPILIKLRVAWDKRIILSKCSKLKSYTKKGIFIVPDEPFEVRMKSAFERLKYRAENAGRRVLITDGVLVIDDVKVFSLQTGYLRNSDG